MVPDTFSLAIESIGPNRVRSIGGQLGIDNQATYRALINKGVPEAQAVWGTHLGKTAQKLEYTKLEFNSSSLEAVFSK